jgi:nucleotide-binding universal stress UspA family protein
VWHGSAAQGVLHRAPCSVVVVPGASAKHQHLPVPAVRRVLVPTDLSELGNQAIPHAYSVMASGGIVQLLYVVEERLTGERLEQMHQVLRAAIPSTVAEDAEGRGIRTQTEVVDAPDPAMAICQAAERLGADLICMASHGRSGMLQTLVGSVAQEVLRTSRRPVLLLRTPVEN